MKRNIIAFILLTLVLIGCSSKEKKKDSVGKKVIKKAVTPLN